MGRYDFKDFFLRPGIGGGIKADHGYEGWPVHVGMWDGELDGARDPCTSRPLIHLKFGFLSSSSCFGYH